MVSLTTRLALKPGKKEPTMNEDLGVRTADEIAEVEAQALKAIETGPATVRV